MTKRRRRERHELALSLKVELRTYPEYLGGLKSGDRWVEWDTRHRTDLSKPGGCSWHKKVMGSGKVGFCHPYVPHWLGNDTEAALRMLDEALESVGLKLLDHVIETDGIDALCDKHTLELCHFIGFWIPPLSRWQVWRLNLYNWRIRWFPQGRDMVRQHREIPLPRPGRENPSIPPRGEA